ncbi:hypothetical protein F4V57_09975 [Acinetobacter qingfengensis]|uniref:DUF4136 domain-containing protein n=1 Tax=Acinetobacter qingfengensis TaxID=1262585 RepID=A0A1E7R550_9GAMM|nr:hypothetical protein [Acinetobacter qingfengensis]KAA8732388.1 hypothetical protein F4V57_09975 [Acinetobacter qingfengensis]OEY94383.1 hypothetical protein BJI46_03310 [Acinetobacter qingfengensis]
MNNIVISLLLCSTVVFTGCATTQQPKTFDQLGHYQIIPLNDSTARISFKADNNRSYGSAEEITLLKSAQITVQQGFDFFKVLNDPSNQLNQQQPRRVVVYPNRPLHPYVGPYGRFYGPFWDDPFYDMPYSVDVDPVEVSYSIQMFKKAQAPADAFDAHRILQSLGTKYGLRPDGSVIIPQPINKTP